jgi:hypothetical protein
MSYEKTSAPEHGTVLSNAERSDAPPAVLCYLSSVS